MIKKQKIAILINSMTGGGAERFVSHLLNHLKNDFDIHLLLLDCGIEYQLPDNQQIVTLGKSNSKSSDFANILMIPFIAYKLFKYCRKNQIPMIISFLNRANFIACFAKILGLKSKVLISERIYTPLWYRTDEIRGKIGHLLVSWLYPFADVILPNSKGTQKALREYYNLQNRFITVKNLVDIEKINAQKNEAVKDVEFGKFTFVNIGRFSDTQKNHDLLIEAFSDLKNENAQLLLIGKGRRLEEMKQNVATLGIQHKVIFLDYTSNPFKYLNKADCFVLSSDFEGFPNVLLEAMACGLPIISTDCKTGPRELLSLNTDYEAQIQNEIEVAQYGILVEVGNKEAMTEAMSKMMKDDKLRNSYKIKSAQRAAEFDSPAVIREFKAIIESFLPSAETKKLDSKILYEQI